MARTTLRAAACAVILSAWAWNTSVAQSPVPANTGDPASPARLPANVGAQPVNQAGFYHHAGVQVQHPRVVPAPLYLTPDAPGLTPTGYPHLNAPLYPVPLPNIPYQTGGAFITNQALDPHEYLYPHRYRSLYPPFYYEVHGCWKVFPWGVAQSERWRLRGTLVKVNYRSSYSLFSGYCPPGLP